MKQIVFDVDLKLEDLYAFTMRHTYWSISGVFSIFISLTSIAYCIGLYAQLALLTRVLLIFVGLLFPVIQPVMLYMKCRKQLKNNKDINSLLQYCLSEEGVGVRQQDESVQIPWHEIRRAVFAKKGIYLYLSPVRAFIFPANQCGGDYNAVRAMIKEQMARHRFDDMEEESPDTQDENDEDEDDEEV